MRFAILLAAGILSLVPLQAQPIPESERDALIAIYNAMDGPNWHQADNWLGPPGTESTWKGVTVRDGHVVGLDSGRNSYQGHLPPEIINLTFLEELLIGSIFLFFLPTRFASSNRCLLN